MIGGSRTKDGQQARGSGEDSLAQAVNAPTMELDQSMGAGQLIDSVGLDPSLFGTHSLRRTEAALIYIGARGACVLCSSCLVTLRLKAQSDTSASKSTTYSHSPTMLTSENWGGGDMLRPTEKRRLCASSRHSPYSKEDRDAGHRHADQQQQIRQHTVSAPLPRILLLAEADGV